MIKVYSPTLGYLLRIAGSLATIFTEIVGLFSLRDSVLETGEAVPLGDLNIKSKEKKRETTRVEVSMSRFQ